MGYYKERRRLLNALNAFALRGKGETYKLASLRHYFNQRYEVGVNKVIKSFIMDLVVLGEAEYDEKKDEVKFI